MEKKYLNIVNIENDKSFSDIRAYFESLINEATTNGTFDTSGMDNEYTREIGRIGTLLSSYEDNVLKLFPIREKTPLVRAIEDFIYSREMKQKDAASLIGVNEATLSSILNGKKKVTMDIAKKLHLKLNIDANILIEFA